ncbi:metallophosphoesterase family protein [Aeoliella sp. SH292]|uniref:metallophosphoesterase family protein n=1 Tax=Aeoliella sp. SH292 TaxID=3454464 RepID=UPI003F953224
MRPEIRFVHSSDWHLEAPLAGLPSLSDDLRALARDAAYLAAEKVVETTLVEGADALLLSGDIVDLERSGPRAIVFLREQFERLNARNVEVYWAGGVTDGPDDWPVVARLPENVHRFGRGRVEQIDQKRDGKVIARIQGVSSADDGSVDNAGFHRDANGVFTVGVAYSTSDSPGREGDRVDYMALGGRHRRATVDNEPGIAHFCGSPQGRTPAESGPSGCTLVHVVDGKTQTKFISTDIIRWVDEAIEVTASTTIEQLEERMDERLDKLRQKSQGTDLLVSFHVRGTGPLVTLLRPGHETDALIARLQKRASKRSPLCWTVGLGCLSAPTVPEEWYDQETILGDFLRQLAEYEEDPRKSLELETLLPTPLSSEVLKSVAKFKNQDHRTRVIENSKKLGLELLTSPEAAMQLG